MKTQAKTKELIDKLGGIKEIYNFINSKGLKISTASIYKWKKNGIPHRYRNFIIEFAGIKNITASEYFSDTDNNKNISMEINEERKISEIKSDKKTIHYSTIILFVILVTFFVYFLYLSNQTSKQLDLMDKRISTVSNSTKISNLENLVNSHSEKIDPLEGLIIKNNQLIKENKILMNDSLKEITENLSFLENNLGSYQKESGETNNLESYKTLIYLMFIKQNISNSFLWADKIIIIDKYLNREKSPENILKALQNIKLLSKENIYSKPQLKKQFFLNTDTKNDDSKTNKESNNIFYKILSFSKQFIKINKSSDLSISTNIKVKNDINEKFVDESFASILGYLDILEESSNLENNSDYISWKKNINQYILLETSIDLIINWLVTKGNFVD